MPNEKWTPGPWKWEDTCGVARLRPANNIGECPEFDGRDPIVDDGSAGGEYGRTIEPDSPNAHLIAAAPDLYEALVLAHRTIEMLLRQPVAWREGLDGIAAVAQAENALAKARGETKDAK